jgi:ribosome-binding factor A
MDQRRLMRVEGLILEEISRVVVRVLQDPRIEGITLTGVRVSKDLRHARVYYSTLGDEARQQECLLGLNSAKGIIKRELARNLRLRYMPEIEFRFDDSLSYADHIQRLLKGLHESGE